MAKILYHAVPVPWRKEEKYAFLEKVGSVAGVKWKTLKPDKKGNWITNDTDEEFGGFLSIGSKVAKQSDHATSIFGTYGRGVCSNNDDFVYAFDAKALAKRARRMVDAYEVEHARWQKAGCPNNVENLVRVDPKVLKWIRRTKKSLARGLEIEFDAGKIRHALYRPFTRRFHYFERVFNEDVYQFPEFFPNALTETENRMISVTDIGSEKPFLVMAAKGIVDMHLVGAGASSQCFPLFTYSEDGKERRDNITPKALTLFQIFYGDDGITRADIFHYVYALLHHPAYRIRYAENLKRELPRIPFIGVGDEVTRLKSPPIKTGKKVEPPHVVSYEGRFYPLSAIEKMQGNAKPDHNPKASAKLFHAFAAAGQKLADLHVNYESAKEFPLRRQENKAVKLDWRVEAMKLSKDKASLFYNDFLTLSGIPAEVFEYRLGNRSALEWVIDQYRVTKDDNGNITSDPNRLDDEQYILRLLGQVINVSLETVKLVKGLPELVFD